MQRRSEAVASARSLLWRFWSQWWLVTLAWYACAVFTIAALKHSREKSMAAMITVFANLVIGWPIVTACTACQGFRQLGGCWRKVLLIGVLTGLEKNLTNASLYRIGASMKTALHGFNVIFTFFAAVLLGVDEPSYWCITGCHCRGNGTLAIALSLVVGGGIVTATCMKDPRWQVSGLGVLLQLTSSLAYALKFTAMKMLLGDAAAQRVVVDSGLRPPSKFQIAFIASPVTGLVGLAFLPFLESWALPEGFLTVASAVAVCVIGSLIFQLRLTELTSPLTVSVLGVLKDVVAVLYFCYIDKDEAESFTEAQAYGYAISMVGVLMYACGRLRQPKLLRAPSTSSIGSAVEQEQAAFVPAGEPR